MEEIYIKINGCEYYVQDSRNGNDSVILLHGWPDDSSLWRFQIPALIQSGYRVICLDWLGHGQSEKTEDLNKYTLASLSADVIGLMDALNLEKAHCIAHDYGAHTHTHTHTRTYTYTHRENKNSLKSMQTKTQLTFFKTTTTTKQ
ncbi:MAG: alpha/beta hydrolase, partial [Moorea sp. SIO1F2]|uniref:alpha/beta fold hydrolase n=1 Tax=Moorena sp. SIO1F2 TaxID=2607819 RepID=UPI0013BE5720